ncbi:FKBP-type peptidyl-prolyl cis-trans isomerase [Candidatus Saccharibacteria bacterium]|nr:FKBP-type peptidyl-prolyl cis-trans isomerase [Candidatus Saccharibacteria bacterium]
MEEKELRTSPKQRFFIILIAIFMVGSIVASYAAIVISGSQGSSSTSEVDNEKLAEYIEKYSELQSQLTEVSQKDFDTFIKYKSEVTGYNETTANAGGVETKDLMEGSGREIGEDDTDYLAYYVGWCADETIFDSSYDDSSNPTGFVKILDVSSGMIEGWTLGVTGMRIGGIRAITIPGELAYGDAREICGGKNKPMKFMIMTKEKTGELAEISSKMNEILMGY